MTIWNTSAIGNGAPIIEIAVTRGKERLTTFVPLSNVASMTPEEQA